MNTEFLKNIIKDQKEKLLKTNPGIKRNLADKIKNDINLKEIVILLGVRRSGKSTLLKQIIQTLMKEETRESNILYLNFEDERLNSFTQLDFEKMYEAYLQLYRPKGRIFIFLDEIQEVSGWEKWAYRIREFETAKLFVTGSNNSILKSEVSKALTGRNITYEEFPFSFKEVLPQSTDSYTQEGLVEIKSTFDAYLEYGGFPEVFIQKRRDFLTSYLRDIISRDMVSRYEIRNVRQFEEFITYLLNLYSKKFTFSKLQHVFNLGSHNTAKNFISYAENAYLVFTVENYSTSLSEVIRAPRKIYAIDHALAAQFSNNPLQDLGSKLENIVFIELRRRLNFDENIFFWQKDNEREVDFIIKKGIKIIKAIQVTYDLNRMDIEVKSLVNALKQFKLKEGLVITYEHEEVQSIKGKKIIFKPAWKFLLNI
ncbi:MAG: ATP-binding protein [Candidatus Marsarchaeota archaeon]|nr:ATP-binding protein [Candidatus Marsarchaeota archaeon]